MASSTDFIFAFDLGAGDPVELTWAQARDWTPGRGSIWIHFHREHESSRRWLQEESGLDEVAVLGLLAGQSRPRIERHGDGFVLTLRGANLAEGADPSDMVSLRMWIEPDRIITLRREKLFAVADLAERMRKGDGPESVGALVVDLVTGLADRMGPVIDDIDDQLDDIEDSVVDDEQTSDRHALATVRQQVIRLHRHLRPQAKALADLYEIEAKWLDEGERRRLKETVNRVMRFVEDLDAAKNRSVVIQDEITNQFSERMNSRMYVLTVVAAICLPMTIISGLFGMNVGGIPGEREGSAFIYICLLMIGFAAMCIIISRWRRWL